MLIGNIENVDNYKNKIIEQKNKVVETQPTSVINNRHQEVQQEYNKYKNDSLKAPLNNENNINKILSNKNDKTEESDKNTNVENKNINNYKYQIPLYNQNFGYNSESKDFFIKVQRGVVELQYPTEEMMKMKIHMQEEIKKLNI